MLNFDQFFMAYMLKAIDFQRILKGANGYSHHLDF